MARRVARPLLEDMRAYAAEAVAYLGSRSDAEFAADRLLVLALARAAEVVGEAAAQVPPAVRAQLFEIEFPAAIAMRNRLIHGYGSLSPSILADTIRDDFPKLIAAIDSALAERLPDEDA